MHEAARVIRDQEPRRLSSLSRMLRGDIETIVAKALEKDPARRYQSASELAADMRRLLRHEPIVARPPSMSYQLGRFARRHKELVAGLAAAFLLMVAGVVSTTIGWFRAGVAEQAAQEQAIRATRASDVLQSILAFARPGMEGGGRDVRVVAMLDEASKRFATQFADVPELEVVARRALGETYLRLGLYAETDSHLARALELIDGGEGKATTRRWKSPVNPSMKPARSWGRSTARPSACRTSTPNASCTSIVETPGRPNNCFGTCSGSWNHCPLNSVPFRSRP
jgi:hypothetical protein